MSDIEDMILRQLRYQAQQILDRAAIHCLFRDAGYGAMLADEVPENTAEYNADVYLDDSDPPVDE